MRRATHRAAVAAAVLASALAALAAPAAAKAPSGVANLEDILTKAKLAEAEQQRLANEKKRDLRKEAVDGYRTKQTALAEWRAVVDIVLDAKTEEAQPYRMQAVDALLKRFEAEDTEKDKAVRNVRLDVGSELAELLIRPAADDKGLYAAELIFTAWYPGQIRGNGWKRDGKPADRKKAYDKIKKWLKDSKK